MCNTYLYLAIVKYPEERLQKNEVMIGLKELPVKQNNVNSAEQPHCFWELIDRAVRCDSALKLEIGIILELRRRHDPVGALGRKHNTL